MLLNPDVPCPCGSEKLTKECCVPTVAPVAAEPTSLRDFRLHALGVYGDNTLGPLPSDLSIEFTINQPHQLDPDVGGITDGIADSMRLVLPAENLMQAGELLGNLTDALHAVRYHQRQYLVRLRMIANRHDAIRGSASQQMSVFFNDYPLTFEIEALVSRFRTSLDAAAHLLALCLGRKPQKYGELATWIQKQRSLPPKVATGLQEALKTYDAWVKRVSDYRHAVAHEGRLKEHKSMGFGAHGVMTARLAEDDAADFVIIIWPKLLAFLKSLFSPVWNQSGPREQEPKTSSDK
jgi:hypothetical protein